jgi:hypothetical protein
VGQFATDCPAGLEQLVNDLLQKSPEARPADAETVARRLKAVTQTIIVKQNLRPFEKPSSGSSTAELTDTKSAPAVLQTTPDRLTVTPRWAWPAVIVGVATFLIVIFSLLSQRSTNEAEQLWLTAFNENNLPIQIAAAKALGELGQSSESATSQLLQALENPPSQDTQLMVAVVTAVGEVGYPAKPAMGTLQKLAQTHSEPPVRSAAQQAAEKLKHAEAPGWSAWVYLNVLTVLAASGTASWLYFTSPS